MSRGRSFKKPGFKKPGFKKYGRKKKFSKGKAKRVAASMKRYVTARGGVRI